MRNILTALFLLLALSSSAQVPVSIHASREDIPTLTRIVSIDAVRDDAILAYANEVELKLLEDYGYSFTQVELPDSKAINLTSSVSELREWHTYPTYSCYVEYMQLMAQQYPTLCKLDTIGYSVNNRLILCLQIHPQDVHDHAPQFFYSSTMHGDEVTGYYFMLRLIDTLLTGYQNNDNIRQLVNSVNIFINPLSNPDGTYHGGDNTLNGAQRYNGNDIDLNRNYPDPFGTPAMFPQQKENTAMIEYISAHDFKVSANLHGGAEVLNYPWDSFESNERLHPESEWWIAVSKRFMDTLRQFDSYHFRDVTRTGYINGGDWYVVTNGRQDYVNYYHNCLEMTMELSSTKKLSSDQLDNYWQFQHRSLINYISEALAFADTTCQGINAIPQSMQLHIYPNPTCDKVYLDAPHEAGELRNLYGIKIMDIKADSKEINLISLPAGAYLVRLGNKFGRIIKR